MNVFFRDSFGSLAGVGAVLAMLVSCGNTDEVRIDITGCAEMVTGQSLLVRVEHPDDFCIVEERCIPMTLLDVTTADLENILRSQSQPLFDLAVEDVGEVLIAVSNSQDCSLSLGFLAACGAGGYEPGSAVEVDLDCSSSPNTALCSESAMCQ